MKKIVYTMMALAMAAITFTACEDVPAPYGIPEENGTTPGGSEEVEIINEGTFDSPYTVAEANELIKTGQNTTDLVFVKGKISKINEVDPSYGNATFFISDDGTTDGQLEIYRAKYLGNKKFTSDEQIKLGDDVILYGAITNYNGTYEMTQGGYIVYLNGETDGVPEAGGEAAGTGTKDDPFNVAAAIKKCQETGETETTEQYYVKGKVATVDASGAAQYGNITIDMVDEGHSAVFKAFQIFSFGGKKFTTDSAAGIKEGDEVVIVGNLVNYKSNTPETTGKGAAQLVSLNGKTDDGSTGGEETTVDPKGTGTESDPFNVAAAIAKCVEAGETATTEQYYVEGVVKYVDASGAAQYHNITLDIVDKGTTTVFKAYQIAGFNGEEFTTETASTIKVGDVVVIKGNLVNYKGNTPETTGKSAGQLVKLNGKAEYGEVPDTPNTSDGNTIVFGSMSYENAQDFDGKSITLGDATLAFSKGSGSTTPKYYTTGAGMRLYGSNTLVISSDKTIAKIVFTYDNGEDSNNRPWYATSSNTSFTPGTYDYSAHEWSGEATSITMSYTGNGGHVRIKSIAITYK